MTETPEPEKSAIRPRRLEFVKFLFAEYHNFAAPSCPKELAGEMVQDLLAIYYEGREPKYAVNRNAWAEAHAYIERYKARKKEWKEKMQNKTQGKTPPPDDGGMFRQSVPDNWKELPRHELEKTMLAAGIALADFHRWYEESSERDWLDKWGHPIRNPIAACRSYTKPINLDLDKEET